MVNAVMNTYARFPLSIVKGEGSFLWDDQGERYLDFTAGIATCNLGHCPQPIMEALETQLHQLWHCSNLFEIPVQTELATELAKSTVFDQVFFCNSGAEANEGAIKLARKYAKTVLKTKRYEIVTFNQSFHGRTLATLTATGQEKVQLDFDPLPAGFRYLPYNDLDALDDLIQDQTAAVLLELVQGEGGVIPADPHWIAKLAQLCDEHDVLLMVDEVQTGMGRTGSLFAYQQYGIEPDVITIAKGFGSGFPIGALLAKSQVSVAFTPGTHGSTFGGNPLACSAALATLKTINQPEFLATVQERAAWLWEELGNLQTKYPQIKGLRGSGLLIGIYLPGIASQVVALARQSGMLLVQAGPEVVRLLPPLTVSKGELALSIEILSKVMEEALSNEGEKR